MKIYNIKRVPKVIELWFNSFFPPRFGYTYNFYWYDGKDGKIYGCNVYKDGEFWHNATQATLDWFEQDYAVISKIPLI